MPAQETQHAITFGNRTFYVLSPFEIFGNGNSEIFLGVDLLQLTAV